VKCMLADKENTEQIDNLIAQSLRAGHTENDE